MQDIRSEKSKLQKQQDGNLVSQQNPPSILATSLVPDPMQTPKKLTDLDLKLGELSAANSTVEKNDKAANKREKKQKRK